MESNKEIHVKCFLKMFVCCRGHHIVRSPSRKLPKVKNMPPKWPMVNRTYPGLCSIRRNTTMSPTRDVGFTVSKPLALCRVSLTVFWSIYIPVSWETVMVNCVAKETRMTPSLESNAGLSFGVQRVNNNYLSYPQSPKIVYECLKSVTPFF